METIRRFLRTNRRARRTADGVRSGRGATWRKKQEKTMADEEENPAEATKRTAKKAEKK